MCVGLYDKCIFSIDLYATNRRENSFIIWKNVNQTPYTGCEQLISGHERASSHSWDIDISSNSITDTVSHWNVIPSQMVITVDVAIYQEFSFILFISLLFKEAPHRKVEHNSIYLSIEYSSTVSRWQLKKNNLFYFKENWIQRKIKCKSFIPRTQWPHVRPWLVLKTQFETNGKNSRGRPHVLLSFENGD